MSFKHWIEDYPIQKREILIRKLYSEKSEKFSLIQTKLLELAKKQNVNINIILGKMQSGKTTLALYLASLYEKLGYQTIYLDGFFEENLPYLYDFDFPVNLVFDDISFWFTHFQQARAFLRYIAKVYHLIGNKVIVNFVIHYSKAILPFLRIADSIFLTSLTTFEEYHALKKLFNTNYLLDFKVIYSKYYYLHPILIKTLNIERIVRKYTPKKPKKIIYIKDLIKFKEPSEEILALLEKRPTESKEEEFSNEF
jgi:hypothetical protein